MSDRTSRKLHTVHLASSYPLTTGDSTAPFMEEMLWALVERDIEVTAVVPRMRGLVEGSRSGVTVIGAPYAPRMLQVWGYGKSLDAENRLRPSALAVAPSALTSMAAVLRRQIKRSRPDIVHLHWVVPQGLLSTVVPKDIPVVISAHGADARFVRGRLRPIAQRVMRRADALVAASSQILELLAEVEPSITEKSHVIPHGANGELFTQGSNKDARLALGLDPDTPLVLAVGRLVSKKGFAPLIRSTTMLADDKARLYIVGEGPERELLERLAGETNGRAHLVGAQPRELVAKWMAASDVVAVPGIADGHDVDSGPVVLMEALATGRPVVASRTGMAPDVIENGVNGYLLDSLDPSDVGAKLTEAIVHAEHLGRGAARTFNTVGDWSRVARALDDVYTKIIRARATRVSG